MSRMPNEHQGRRQDEVADSDACMWRGRGLRRAGRRRVAAKVVVVRSVGPSAKAYPPGKALPDSAKISLQQGDSVTLIGPSSARRRCAAPAPSPPARRRARRWRRGKPPVALRRDAHRANSRSTRAHGTSTSPRAARSARRPAAEALAARTPRTRRSSRITQRPAPRDSRLAGGQGDAPTGRPRCRLRTAPSISSRWRAADEERSAS